MSGALVAFRRARAVRLQPPHAYRSIVFRRIRSFGICLGESGLACCGPHETGLSGRRSDPTTTRGSIQTLPRGSGRATRGEAAGDYLRSPSALSRLSSSVLISGASSLAQAWPTCAPSCKAIGIAASVFLPMSDS